MGHEHSRYLGVLQYKGCLINTQARSIETLAQSAKEPVCPEFRLSRSQEYFVEKKGFKDKCQNSEYNNCQYGPYNMPPEFLEVL
jgi:hypothetical protein